MSSGSFWSDACKYAEGKPLQAQLNAAYGLTVRRAHDAAAAALCFAYWVSERLVTRCRADCLVLRERFCGGDHVLLVAAHGGGGPGARVAAVRMVQRADGVRQLRRSSCVGG